MKILIVGGGKALYFLCRTFLAKGHEVTVINRDPGECVRIARALRVTVVRGDGTDPAILEQAGAYAAETVVALTPNDQDNLAICQVCRVQYDVPRAVALALDPDNAAVFQKLGVEAFSITPVIATLIEQRTQLDDITNLIPAGEGKVNITELVLPPAAPVIDKPLREVLLPPDSLIAVVLREGAALVPRGNTFLRAGDRIVLISLPANHGETIKAITGDTL